MSGPTKAQWDALGAGATQCHTSSAAIQQAVQNMLNQLSGVQWKGSAATAFANAQLNVQADSRTIVQRLEAIATGIEKTSASFMETDDEARRSLDNVTGGTAATGVNGTDVSAGLA